MSDVVTVTFRISRKEKAALEKYANELGWSSTMVLRAAIVAATTRGLVVDFGDNMKR